MKINWERMTLIFVGILTLLRLAVAPTFGLGVDEAHYFLYARFLDWSYVDHPPLVGWTHWPLYAMFGTNEFLVRLPAILLFAGVSLFVYRFTFSFSESGLISFLSVVAVNSSFILNAMGLMLLPDCFLLLLVFPLMTTIRKIAETGEIRYFVCLGLLLGLAGLAKYTAVLFIPPLLIFLIMKRRYQLIFSPGMFLAAGIALLMISPVLYWNMQNDFISFRYQGGHVLAATSPSIKYFFVSLLTQFGAYSPFLFLMAFYGLYKGWKSTDDNIRLSVLFGVVILSFFFYSSLYERTLPHWPSLFYLLFIPIGAYYLLSAGSSKKRKYFYFSVGFSLTITLFLYAALPAKWFTFPDYKSPFRDIVGFETIAREGDAILRRGMSIGAGSPSRNAVGHETAVKKEGGAQHVTAIAPAASGPPAARRVNSAAAPPPGASTTRKALAVTNWTMGSRMLYYNLPYGHEVFVVDDRKDQFDVWQQAAPKGYDLLFVNTHFHKMDVPRNYRCDAAEPVKTMDISLNGGKVDTIEFVWCRNYQGPR
jgi:hypothetical protein